MLTRKDNEAALPADEQTSEHTETLTTLRRSIEEFERGEGKPAEQAFEELREKHGICRTGTR